MIEIKTLQEWFIKSINKKCANDIKLVSVESLINHIKDMPYNNVKAELMSLLGGHI